MAKIKITCDSASDLPKALAERYRIGVLPLNVRIGSSAQKDQLDTSVRELYAYSQETGRLPDIAPISQETYRSYFQDLLNQDFQVLHISVSSKISDCYRNACAAAEGLPNVCIIDSQSISAGAAQLALLASELASADYLLEDLERSLNHLKEHLKTSFLLKSSMLLKRKGKRKTWLPAETIFHMHPYFSLKKGWLHFEKPFRGESAISSYLQKTLENRRDIQTDRIIVTYSGLSQPVLDKVTESLRKLQPFEQILMIPASSAVTCRCGPGSLGLAYLTI